MSTHTLNAAIADYARLIEDDWAGAEAQMAQLYALQREHNVLFGDRIPSHSLRPTFLTEAMYRRVQDAVYAIRQGILRIGAATFHDRNVLQNTLGLREWEMELALLPQQTLSFSALSRLDAFLTDDGSSFRFVEVNGESPAGQGYVHELAQIYQKLPIFQRFTERWPVRYISPMEHTLQTLLRLYHGEHGGVNERPVIAIVDHLDIPTVHEFHILADYFGRMGMDTVVIDPRDVEEQDGWLVAEGKRVDIVYRRLLTNEFYDIRADCGAFERAYRAGKSCFLNSFRAKMVHKKAIFAVLTDPDFTRLLDPHTLGVIQQHVPWTRRFSARYTDYHGEAVDLVALLRRHPERFVLKPNDEYGGKGVFLGFDDTTGAWDTAIETALADGDYVVQEAVRIHREPFLVQTANGWEYVPTVIDLDPYVFGPMVGGCLTRTSATNLANVTAGGGTLPMFILRNTFV